MPAEIKTVVIHRKITPELSQHMLSDIEKLPGVQLGDFLLQIELDEPRESVREIARKELRETPEVVKPAVDELRRLLKEDKDLYVPLDNDAWLIRFLRPCKFYPDSAHDLIKRYYAFKLKHHKQYDGLVPSKETNIFNQNILTVLPTRDQLGRRVLVLELGKKWKHNKCSLDEVFKGCVLFLEAAMLEPETQICGAVVVFDMDGLSLQQVWQFTPPFAKRIVDWLQESIPLRVKGLYIVNQPYIFNMVFQLFKPFIQEKLRSRIIFIGNDRDLLHSYVTPKCLPDCYGGTLSLPRVTGAQWLELLLMCDQEFSAINSYGYKKK
ncbi:alpha-tocopherol transfer protein-like isoform X1 [Plodia interpunctella]|uniref:alpha-tocopherol transfer protein-like isoform X1 n=1 Tax=Plodia interpunctella TaxID=58824 RepID=UPI00236872AA|nr:alpha-tocopherol transfer protein-like isoform X1 [Plodia interpunctella]